MVFYLEKLRNFLYWTVDFIKGGVIRRHYNDIKFTMEHYSSPTSKLRREKHLKNQSTPT